MVWDLGEASGRIELFGAGSGPWNVLRFRVSGLGFLVNLRHDVSQGFRAKLVAFQASLNPYTPHLNPKPETDVWT